MAQLSKSEQELIVARMELGLTYEEMADALGKPSCNAVRLATARALLRLGEELRLGQQRPADRDRGGDR
jgi:RNA polymerase sigma-70 factor (ECF subfamily)